MPRPKTLCRRSDLVDDLRRILDDYEKARRKYGYANMAIGENFMTFLLGDSVTWTSQSNGTTRTKTGTIVAVVPPNVTLTKVFAQRADLNQHNYNLDNIPSLYYTYCRPRESYIIAVTMLTRTGKRKARPQLYWPRVAWLQKAREEAEDAVV